MCGRFVLFTSDELLAEVGSWPGISEVHAPEDLPPARYNIAPTQMVPIVRVSESFAEVTPARWGLLPHWKKDLTGPPLFNARAETVASKPSFRDAFRKGRCVIPLDGYYEWHDDGTGKVPYYVTGPEGMLWAAGLWATGMDQLSATMVTTAATDEMSWLHARLPKFLARDEIMPWLSGEELLEPSTLRGFATRKADPAVGNVRNDYAELIDEQPPTSLF
ncbi:SOS response-associated peptidase [Corynebacterium breve]|uniref:Abasic site processing protein n=1 Tax=Corynebacterium breve TaxID=3049799 RepID=A0ABY8VG53_9CORY|nr:SOS response-associated peptidase [Corynebacterium breve]WIM68292.1 SOS response-associated peptidase [Corynebacterium breve]